MKNIQNFSQVSPGLSKRRGCYIRARAKSFFILFGVIYENNNTPWNVFFILNGKDVENDLTLHFD